jgi:hypothetical protein
LVLLAGGVPARVREPVAVRVGSLLLLAVSDRVRLRVGLRLPVAAATRNGSTTAASCKSRCCLNSLIN